MNFSFKKMFITGKFKSLLKPQCYTGTGLTQIPVDFKPNKNDKIFFFSTNKL